jgi:hypothetical protein
VAAGWHGPFAERGLIPYIALLPPIVSLGIAGRGTKPSLDRWLPDSRADS